MQGAGTNRRNRIIIESLLIILLLAIVLFDQLTKYHFSSTLSKGERIPVIEGFFYFTHQRNSGSAWSFLSNVSWAQTFFKVLTIFALITFVIVYVYSYKKNYKWLKIALIFVIAGTIGNFIDRLLFNEVIDFLSFIFWGYYFPVFNVADCFLVVGTIMIIIHLLFLDENAILKKNNAKKDV